MTENTEKVGWNLGMIALQEIGNLMQGASNNYISGNYLKAFSYLRAIRMRLPEINDEERKEMKEREMKFAKLNPLVKPQGFRYAEKSNAAALEIFQLYGEYNDLVLGALKKYGYLLPAYEDNTNLNK